VFKSRGGGKVVGVRVVLTGLKLASRRVESGWGMFEVGDGAYFK
jgi:hypothetical protein